MEAVASSRRLCGSASAVYPAVGTVDLQVLFPAAAADHQVADEAIAGCRLFAVLPPALVVVLAAVAQLSFRCLGGGEPCLLRSHTSIVGGLGRFRP